MILLQMKSHAPEKGIKKSSFSEATNERGIEQFMHVFQKLQEQAKDIISNNCPDLGNLVGIDGSLIDATLSMYWADYRKSSKKAKVHVGFDLNRSIPRKIFLTDGKGAERPLVSRIISEGETGVMDRGYQCHKAFDLWQTEQKAFICRIKTSTRKKDIESHPVEPDSIVFYDATVLLGTAGTNQTFSTAAFLTIISLCFHFGLNRFKSPIIILFILHDFYHFCS